MSSEKIYLDNNATTPCDPRVVEQMLPYFSTTYGNPANGLHIQGRAAAQAVEIARSQVAELIGAQPNEIIFTSGATESNNLAILGLARSDLYQRRKRIIISSVEHKSVLAVAQKLQETGYECIQLPVDKNGRVILETAQCVIDENTLIVTVQAANNEVGTLQPIKELAELAQASGAFFHSDGAQAAGKVSIDIHNYNVDLLSLSAHKLYGPKGIGALFIRGGVREIALEPLIYGGGQENGLRSGTMNVSGIVGFGEACRIAHEALAEESHRIVMLRDELEKCLTSAIPDLRINAQTAERLPNTSSITFDGFDADAFILNLNSVMIGTGSACTSGAIDPSHVLTAMGLTREQAFSTVRISLGRFNTLSSIEKAVKEIIDCVDFLKHLE